MQFVKTVVTKKGFVWAGFAKCYNFFIFIFRLYPSQGLHVLFITPRTCSAIRSLYPLLCPAPTPARPPRLEITISIRGGHGGPHVFDGRIFIKKRVKNTNIDF